MLDALNLCFSTTSFRAPFYNLVGDKFEEVTCDGFASLEKRSAQQVKDLNTAKEIIKLLFKETEKITAARARNDSLLRDVLQRQLTLNLVMLQILGKDHKIEPSNEQLAKINLALQQHVEPAVFNGAQLQAHVERQACVVAALIQTMQQRGTM